MPSRPQEQRSFEPGAVAGWLREVADERRVTALGMMQAEPVRRDFPAVLSVIDRPRSSFEQYRALRLADMMIGVLGTTEKELLVRPVRTQRELGLRLDSSRWQLCRRILRHLGEDDPGDAG